MSAIPQGRITKSAPDTSQIRALNISLGVEFEFIVLEFYEEGRIPTWEERRSTPYSLSLLTEVLKKPIRFTCSSCGEAHNCILDLNEQTAERAGSDPNRWNVLCDDSVKLETLQTANLRKEDCDVFSVELTSRVLFNATANWTTRSTTNAGHMHTITYQQEITGVLEALHTAFNTRHPVNGPHSGRRLVTNYTCALHVHVGNGSTGFTLQTVKNLLSLCTAFERVIDEMHAASRIGCSGLDFADLEYFGSDDDNNMAEAGSMTSDVFNKALTERLIGNAYMTRRDDNHTPDIEATRDHYPANAMNSDPVLKQAASDIHTMAFVHVIQSAPNMKSLREMLSSCSETSVSINYLIAGDRDEVISDTRQYTRFNTIEFRQHAAVTDAKEALPWIAFLQALVKYADSTSPEIIISECERAASDPFVDLPALFELLDVGHETRNYYLNRSNEMIQHSIDAARMQVESFGAEDPFRQISLDLLNERAEDHDLDNVSKVIRNKFQKGGYGQFSREFIDGYAPLLENKLKDELEIGWNIPFRDDSDEEMSIFDSLGLLDDL
jgi:hypothetical protein